MTDQQEKVDALVAELRSAAEKATPGERFWALDKHSQCTNLMTRAGDYVLSPQVDLGNYGLSADCWIDLSTEDEAYIALANPANILTLLTAFAAEREENERLRGYLDDAEDVITRVEATMTDLSEPDDYAPTVQQRASDLVATSRHNFELAGRAQAQITAQAERIAFLERGIREAQDSLRFNQDDVIWFGGASLETLWEHLESVRDPDSLDPGCPEDDRKTALSADTGSREG